MNLNPPDVSETVARHERDIRQLREQVRDIETGYEREKLKAEIEQRVAELETEIKFQELQETIAREEEQKQRRRRFLGIF